VKKRLDVLLVERGLADSRAQAQALVMAGRVPGYEKPGTQVEESAQLEVEAPARYVSRGGEKLAHALDALGVDPAGRGCLDVGASTGGFTDVLLQRGAARVIAVDVGYGQLHETLRRDPRVRVLERTNVRHLAPADAGGPFEVVVADLSFISLRTVAPALLGLAAPGADLVLLVKPQFEAGRAEADRGKGVIRDPTVWGRVLDEVGGTYTALGASMMGIMVSPVRGADGNVEFLAHLRAGGGRH
jgi:23S rRNA (cytidine1920-2'-O)/16S rRNA (cytidine1409-2'-O)-methyltransferase